MKAKLTVSVEIDLDPKSYPAGEDMLEYERTLGVASSADLAVDHIGYLLESEDTNAQVSIEAVE